MKKVFPSGAVLVQSQSQGAYMVNGQRLKEYHQGDSLEIEEDEWEAEYTEANVPGSRELNSEDTAVLQQS